MTGAEDIEGSQKGQIVERRYYAEGAAKHHSKDQNLTVFAKHKVVRGKEEEYRQWTKEINTFLFGNFEGYQGAETVRPTTCESNEYVNIFRFDNYEHLQLWMDSEERLNFLDRTKEFDEAPIETSYHSLEYWFVQDETDDKKPAPSPPSKEKMAVVTFLLIWLQVHFIGPAVGSISELPGLLAEALTVLIVVIGTTYLWMPLTTKYILRWWLFPNPDKVWYFLDKKKKNEEGVVSPEDLIKKHSLEPTEKNLDGSVVPRKVIPESSDVSRSNVEEV